MSIKKEKSLSVNILFSAIKTALSILFPLVSYKYAANVLSVDNLGRVEYARSIVSYFVLLAGLGINTFAIRNAASIRNNKEKLNIFFNEIFGISIISTLLSFSILLLIAFFGIKSQFLLIMVFSAQIILSSIGFDWLYIAFEDYRYLTIRTIICQIVAFFILVCLVKNKNDVYWYSLCLITATYGSNIYGFFYSQKYVTLKPVIRKTSFKWLPSILVLFANNIATTIYVNSDVTMMGVYCGTYDIGIYSAAVKIYTAVKMVISTVLNVLLPRFSYYVNNDEMEKYIRYESQMLKLLIIMVMPCVIFTFCHAQNAVIIISGEEYIDAAKALEILGLAVLFSAFAMLMSSTILLPLKREKSILLATSCGAVTNILINLFILKKYSFNGAAFSTLISELIVCLILFYFSRDIIKKIKLKLWNDLISCIIGSLGIYVMCTSSKMMTSNPFIQITISLVIGSVMYLFLLLLLKNDSAINLFKTLLQGGKNGKISN